MEYSLEGKWQVRLTGAEDQTERDLCYEMTLPGTLDENRIGYRDTGKNQWHMEETGDRDNDNPDKASVEADDSKEILEAQVPIATRFTRKYTFEGEARLTRKFYFTEKPGKRIFLEAERARVLGLLIDGQEVPHVLPPSISTPQVFEVTGKIDGTHEITLLSDNSYPGLPREQIIYSSAATDETQTNWNGVLGYLRLREEQEMFLREVRVYPKIKGDAVLSMGKRHARLRKWHARLTPHLPERHRQLKPLRDGQRRLVRCVCLFTYRWELRKTHTRFGCIRLWSLRVPMRYMRQRYLIRKREGSCRRRDCLPDAARDCGSHAILH
ncbi:MAG: hypothetical protein LUD16_02100 [Lachnospiraceae bacterium]|nr:hypothetical protein [Lachnospiraceae bacterium]